MTQNLQKFHGVWKLTEWSVTQNATNTTRLPFGGHVDGHIIYSPDGWVSATLMEKNRPALSQDRLATGQLKQQLLSNPQAPLSQEEVSKVVPWFLAGFGYISYCGPFEIDDMNVHHHIQNSMMPQWVGTTLVRNFSFDEQGNQLTLSAEQEDTTDKLVWQRLNQAV